MANLRALIRETTGGIRNLVPGGADTLEVSDIDYAGGMVIGVNATGIDIGKAAILTTVKGNFQVDGTTTLVSTSTLEGDVDLGDGGNTITIGGDGVAGAGDVIYLGTESTGVGTDSETTVRTLMTVDGNAYSGGIDGDDATLDFSDAGCGVILPNVASGAAVTADGSIIVDGSDFKWYDGAVWYTAGTAAGNTLQQSYDAGTGTIALDASGDFQIELDNATGDVFAVLSSTGGADNFMLTSTGADAMGLSAALTTALISASSTMDLDAAGALSINSSGAAINIGNDAIAQAINVGTGAAARTITIGNATGVTAVDIKSGTAGINLHDGVAQLDLNGAGALTETALVSANITPSGILTLRGGGVSQFGDDVGYFAFDGAGALTTAGITTMDLDSSGALQINSSAGAISIGNDAVAQNISIGTGAAARTIAIGNATGATALDLDAGTGGVTINATATADIALTVADNAGSDIIFTAHGSATNFNEAGANAALVGFTEDNVIGALNELKGEISGVGVWTGLVDTAAGIAANDLVCIDDSQASGILDLADADVAGRKFCVGICTVGAAQGASASVVSSGKATAATSDAGAWSAGAAIFIDTATAGEATNDVTGYGSGDMVQRVGWATGSGRQIVVCIGEPTLI